jgi:hypothetical protein
VFVAKNIVGYFEFVTATSPATLAGTYAIKDPVDAAGQMVTGSWMNTSWFGGPDQVIESGSYYVDNGEKMFIRAGAGEATITVTETNGALYISGTGLPIQDITQMYWGLLPDPGSVNFTKVKPQ